MDIIVMAALSVLLEICKIKTNKQLLYNDDGFNLIALYCD
jgi:hypothetical protein